MKSTPTEFAERVYEKVKMIPKGKVATYGAVAAVIGGKAARAVGSALARNPYAPVVPCHRVVRADGTVGGFSGQTCGAAPQKKRSLLETEGVEISPSGKVRLDQYGYFFDK